MFPYLCSCHTLIRLETLFQHVTVGTKSGYQPFEQEIVWRLISNNTVLFVHGDKVLKQAGTYSDYRGSLFRTRDLNELENSARHYSITPASSLQVLIESSVYLEPSWVSPEAEKEQERYLQVKNANPAHRYLSDVSNDWRTQQKNSHDEGPEFYYPNLLRQRIWTGLTASSEFDAAGNELKFAQQIAEHDLQLLIDGKIEEWLALGHPLAAALAADY